MSTSPAVHTRQTLNWQTNAACNIAWGVRKTSKIVPSPTYWMSLSHTLHHLSPGSPNGHPESTRTKKKRKEHSQNISRIFEVKLWASSLSLYKHRSASRGRQTAGQPAGLQRLNDMISEEEKLGRTKPPSGDKWTWKRTIISFFLKLIGIKVKKKKPAMPLKEKEQRRQGVIMGESRKCPHALTYPSALHMIYIDSLWRCASESLLTLWITAILLTLFVLVEWELSCKDEILFTFVIKRLWREKEHGANGYICHGHADKITFCTKWDIKNFLQGKLKNV